MNSWINLLLQKKHQQTNKQTKATPVYFWKDVFGAK